MVLHFTVRLLDRAVNTSLQVVGSSQPGRVFPPPTSTKRKRKKKKKGGGVEEVESKWSHKVVGHKQNISA